MPAATGDEHRGQEHHDADADVRLPLFGAYPHKNRHVSLSKTPRANPGRPCARKTHRLAMSEAMCADMRREILVEATGVEPVSEKTPTRASTGLARDFHSRRVLPRAGLPRRQPRLISRQHRDSYSRYPRLVTLAGPRRRRCPASVTSLIRLPVRIRCSRLYVVRSF